MEWTKVENGTLPTPREFLVIGYGEPVTHVGIIYGHSLTESKENYCAVYGVHDIKYIQYKDITCWKPIASVF